MPPKRSKRNHDALADLDANSLPQQPAPKAAKTTKGDTTKAASKAASTASKTSNAKTTSTSKAKPAANAKTDAPKKQSGKAKDSTDNTTTSESTSAATRQAEGGELTERQIRAKKAWETKRLEAEKSKEWVAACKPEWAIWLEKYEANGRSRAGIPAQDEIETGCGYKAKGCVCEKPLSAVTADHVFIFTKKGLQLAKKWMEKAGSIEPTDLDGSPGWGVSFAHDFDLSDIVEIREEQILALDRELRKKKPDVPKLWSVLESVALFLTEGPADDLSFLDDADRINGVGALYGAALIRAINLLIEKKLFAKDSEIKNIAQVLNMFLKFGDEVSDLFDWAWPAAALYLAKKHMDFELHPGLEVETIDDESEIADFTLHHFEADPENPKRPDYTTETLNPDWQGLMTEYVDLHGREAVPGKSKPAIGIVRGPAQWVFMGDWD